MIISDKPIIELTIFVDGEEREYFISGHNGRFNWGLLQEFEDDFQSNPSDDLEKLIEKNELDYGTITLLATLTENEPETQYGTGYGDLLTFKGYYDMTIISVTKINKDVRPIEVENEDIDVCKLLF